MQYTVEELELLREMLVQAHDHITTPDRHHQRVKKFYRLLIRLIDDMDVLVPNGDTPRISRHLISNKDTIFEVLPGDITYKKGISYQSIHLIWYKKSLKYMPLYISDPYFQVIAHWRLKIGK